MAAKVLYMGDTALECQASYLAGIMNAFDIDFDYVRSSQRFFGSMLNKNYSMIILSDYPSSNFTASQLELLKTKIMGGLGLLMIGGWESFVGQAGGYNKTILANVLPVEMGQDDDRVNWWGPCLVEKTSDHMIVNSLPLNKEMPVIGGFNTVKAKSNTVTILSARRFSVSKDGNNFTFASQGVNPLLVAGGCGRGRVTAFTSDVAPHWVGGLVDWGHKRIVAHADGASEVEVGEYYAALFANIIRWTGGI